MSDRSGGGRVETSGRGGLTLRQLQRDWEMHVQHSSASASKKLYDFLGIESPAFGSGKASHYKEDALLDEKVAPKKKVKVKLKKKKSKKKKFSQKGVVPLEAVGEEYDETAELNPDDDVVLEPESGEEGFNDDDNFRETGDEPNFRENEGTNGRDTSAIQVDTSDAKSPKPKVKSKVLERYTGKMPYDEPPTPFRASPSKLQVYLNSRYSPTKPKEKSKPPPPKQKAPEGYRKDHFPDSDDDYILKKDPVGEEPPLFRKVFNDTEASDDAILSAMSATAPHEVLKSKQPAGPARRPQSAAPMRSRPPHEPHKETSLPISSSNAQRGSSLHYQELPLNRSNLREPPHAPLNNSTAMDRVDKSRDPGPRRSQDPSPREIVHDNVVANPNLRADSEYINADVQHFDNSAPQRQSQQQRQPRRPEPMSRPPPVEVAIPNPISPSKVVISENAILNMNPHDVCDFLVTTGFGYYAENFLKMGVWGEDLLASDDADLQACGITYKPHRRKLIEILNNVAPIRRSRIFGPVSYDTTRVAVTPVVQSPVMLSPQMQSDPVFQPRHQVEGLSPQQRRTPSPRKSPRKDAHNLGRSFSDGAMLRNRQTDPDISPNQTFAPLSPREKVDSPVTPIEKSPSPELQKEKATPVDLKAPSSAPVEITSPSSKKVIQAAPLENAKPPESPAASSSASVKAEPAPSPSLDVGSGKKADDIPAEGGDVVVSVSQEQKPSSPVAATQQSEIKTEDASPPVKVAEPTAQDGVTTFQESLKTIDSKLFFDMLAKALREDLALLVSQQNAGSKPDAGQGGSVPAQREPDALTEEYSMQSFHSEHHSNRVSPRGSGGAQVVSRSPSNVAAPYQEPVQAQWGAPSYAAGQYDYYGHEAQPAAVQGDQPSNQYSHQVPSQQELQSAYYAHSSHYGSFGSAPQPSTSYAAQQTYEYDPNYQHGSVQNEGHDAWRQQRFGSFAEGSVVQSADYAEPQAAASSDPNYYGYYHGSQHFGSFGASQYDVPEAQYGEAAAPYQEPYYHSTEHYYEPSYHSLPAQEGYTQEGQESANATATYTDHSNWTAADILTSDQAYVEGSYPYAQNSYENTTATQQDDAGAAQQAYDNYTVDPMAAYSEAVSSPVVDTTTTTTGRPPLEHNPSAYLIRINPTLSYENREEKIELSPSDNYSIDPYGMYGQQPADAQPTARERSVSVEGAKPSSLKLDTQGSVDGAQAAPKTVRWDENTIGSRGSKIDNSVVDAETDAISLDSGSQRAGDSVYGESYDAATNSQHQEADAAQEESPPMRPVDPEFNAHFNPFMDLLYGDHGAEVSENNEAYFMDPNTNQLYDANNNTDTTGVNGQANYDYNNYNNGYENQSQQPYWGGAQENTNYDGGYTHNQYMNYYAPQYAPGPTYQQQSSSFGNNSNSPQQYYSPTYSSRGLEEQYEEGQFGAHMDPFVDDDPNGYPVDYDPNNNYNYNYDTNQQYGYDQNAYHQNYYSQGGDQSWGGAVDDEWGSMAPARGGSNSNLLMLAMGSPA